MKLSSRAKILAVTLVAYVVGDILLTPVAGFETRPVAKVTVVGLATLGLLFVGLVVAIVSLVLLFRRSSRATTLAIVAAFLYFPAVLAERTDHFSSLRPPTAIEWIELVQVVVALALIGVGVWTRRESTGNTSTR